MKPLWSALGWFAIGLGAVGTFLPVLPTVPFLLIAAWAFTKSSPNLHEQIRTHTRYGATVRAWQDRGAIPRLAKIWAIATMIFSFGLSTWIGLPLWILMCQGLVCLAVAIWMARRPEH